MSCVDTATVHPLGLDRSHGVAMNEENWANLPDMVSEWSPVLRLVSEVMKHGPQCWRMIVTWTGRGRRRHGRHRAER